MCCIISPINSKVISCGTSSCFAGTCREVKAGKTKSNKQTDTETGTKAFLSLNRKMRLPDFDILAGMESIDMEDYQMVTRGTEG
jgi:hypothetical protein